MRYSGPKHISEIYLSARPAQVVDGALELDDDASAEDHAAVRSLGFMPDSSKEKPAPKQADAAATASAMKATEQE